MAAGDISYIDNYAITELKKPNTYSIRIRLPKDDDNPKRSYSLSRRITAATRRDILLACIEYEDELKNADELARLAEQERLAAEAEAAKHIVLKEYLYGDYSERRQDQIAAGNLSGETLKRRASDMKLLTDYFGDTYLQDLNEKDLSRGFALMRRNGLSEYQVHNAFQLLNQALTYAKIGGYIDKNPIDDMIDKNKPRRPKVSKAKKKERQVTALEATKLIHTIEENPLTGEIVLVFLALTCGLRRGESLGLQWNRIDLENGLITIDQQYTNDKRLKDPKADSARIIRISQGVADQLRRWRTEQQLQFKRQNDLYNEAIQNNTKPRRYASPVEWTPSVHLCTNKAGNVLDPSHVSQRVCKYLVSQGLGSYRETKTYRSPNGTKRHYNSGHEGPTLHSLRRCHASLLLSAGLPLKDIQARLGHASASMTLEWYIENSAEGEEEAARLISEALEIDTHITDQELDEQLRQQNDNLQISNDGDSDGEIDNLMESYFRISASYEKEKQVVIKRLTPKKVNRLTPKKDNHS